MLADDMCLATILTLWITLLFDGNRNKGVFDEFTC